MLFVPMNNVNIAVFLTVLAVVFGLGNQKAEACFWNGGGSSSSSSGDSSSSSSRISSIAGVRLTNYTYTASLGALNTSDSAFSSLNSSLFSYVSFFKTFTNLTLFMTHKGPIFAHALEILLKKDRFMLL